MSSEESGPSSSWIPTAAPTAGGGGVAGMGNAAASAPLFTTTTTTTAPGGGGQVLIDETPQESHRHYKGVHPIAAFFHIFFKVAALVLFLFGSIFSSSVFLFIIIILLLSFDFWTTKNITGRLLVSLRWWSEVGEDGNSHWVFESCPDNESGVNPYDRWFFWIVLGVNVLLWSLFCLFNIMSLARLSIAIVGLVLGCVNAVGYTKCRREKTRLGEFILRQAAERPQFLRGAAETMFKG